MKVLLDTNIVLDYILKRASFFEYSKIIFEKAFMKTITVYISATTVTDIYYIVQKSKGKKYATNFIKDILQFIYIAEVNKDIILLALYSSFSDFEDAIQNYVAEESEITHIITRNTKDYKKSKLEIITPENFTRNLMKE